MTTEKDITNNEENQTFVEVYTDGSCIGNPGFGGYGAVIIRKNKDGEIIKKLEISGPSPVKTTNNRMEITAVCEALAKLATNTKELITVFCDAALITNAMNSWMPKWKANGWTGAKRKPIENVDLWKLLDSLREGRLVSFVWVRGHNGNEHNETADSLAYAAARQAEEAGQ